MSIELISVAIQQWLKVAAKHRLRAGFDVSSLPGKRDPSM